MKIQKKKIYFACVVIVLICVLLSIAFTYSKYSNLDAFKSSASIASWNFNVSANGTTTDTIDLTSTYDKDTLVNGKIAPGTKGSFNLCLDASGSDVGVDYQIEFLNEENHPDNLVFKYGDFVTNDIIQLEARLSGEISLTDQDKVRNITIEWEWPYETNNDNGIIANDRLDTKAGINADTYSLVVSVTAKQVLPR